VWIDPCIANTGEIAKHCIAQFWPYGVNVVTVRLGTDSEEESNGQVPATAFVADDRNRQGRKLHEQRIANFWDLFVLLVLGEGRHSGDAAADQQTQNV